ncbi:MAG: Gfo/Idh/MocA family oxidoreductase [Spirochaetales bacterium]|nr:Gfo/Idh/MocA family oxidoreductase [Spirochaetales bacterium]
MDRKLRFGIIGFGMIGYYHAEVIRQVDGCELVSCTSASYSSAQKLAEKFNIEAKPSIDDLLSDERINFVTICSPSGNHYEAAKQALFHNRNVVVEKPMCLSLEEADELIALAKEKGLALCVISQTRFSDSVQAIRRAVENNEFGKMVSAQLMMRYSRPQSYYDQADWRGTVKYDGGGVLMNQGIHGIDVLCYIMGRPKSVMGYATTRLRDIEVEDTAVAAVEFENGSVGSIDATVCSTPSFAKKFIICGEKGTVILEDDSISLWALPSPCPVSGQSTTGGSASADPRGINTEYHRREFENIRDHYMYGKPLLIDGDQGRIPLSVILGLYSSSRNGVRIPL